MFDLKAFRGRLIPTQAQIISQWQEGAASTPLVSVICTAFNQGNYIEDALKSFLMQRTDFPFEIIIHDDASTDNTAAIINDYVRNYPLIIKPIFQKNNQFSINGHLPFLNTLKASVGTYLALCEGDDFWIDENKIQKQLEELESNKSVNILITKVFSLSSDNSLHHFCDLGKSKKIIPFEQCILGPEKDFYPTASFFIRKKALKNLPEWFINDAPVGDYYIHLFGSFPNGCIYLPTETTIYRINSVGSLSSMMNSERFLSLRYRSYFCGEKLLELYGGNESFKEAIIKKQVEYLFHLFLVSLKLKKLNESVKYLLKSLSLHFFYTVKYFFVQFIKILERRFV